MKTSERFVWLLWLCLIGFMLFTHDKQRMEIQRLNGVVYELRMERVEWLHNIQVMEARVASVELREDFPVIYAEWLHSGCKILAMNVRRERWLG